MPWDSRTIRESKKPLESHLTFARLLHSVEALASPVAGVRKSLSASSSRYTTPVTTDDRDGASVRVPPPVVYLAAVIGGGLVDRYLVSLPLVLPGGVRFGAATVATVLGIGVMAAAIGLFRQTGQDPKPWESTPEIISTGVYRLTRNPMYVGMALLQAGIGFALTSAWIIALVPVVLAVVYATAVRHEEAYLEEKFGADYLSYKNEVRRWI